jgi:hypothetical protein
MRLTIFSTNLTKIFLVPISYQNRLPQSHRSPCMVTVTVEIVVDSRTNKKRGETGGKVVTPKLF